VLLGIGNSLFHVWGGKQVVMKVGNDIRCLGVFVSTGVFGLSVAMVFCSWTLLYVFLLAICILATVYIMTDKQVSTPSRHETNIAPLGFAACSMQERSSFNAQHLIALTALAAFVMFRSYIGTEFAFGTEKSDFVLLAIGSTSMLGKMAGGWISRWFGILRALIVMLVIVLVCMLTGSKSLMVLLLGLFMINCTMPITLYLANYVLPEREGLAFGILAAALMPGYLLKS
jgi:predicted MFS family arabinose efflux permease